MIALLTYASVSAGTASLAELCRDLEIASLLQDYYPTNPLTLACFTAGPTPLALAMADVSRTDLWNYLISNPAELRAAVRGASARVPIEIDPEAREGCLSGSMVECYKSIATFADLTETDLIPGLPHEIEPLFRLNRVFDKLNVAAVRALVSNNLADVTQRALLLSRGTPFHEELISSTEDPGVWFSRAPEPVRGLLAAEATPVLGLEGLFEYPSKIKSYSMNRHFWLSFYSSTNLDEVYAAISDLFVDYTRFYSAAGGLHYLASFPGAVPLSPRCRHLVGMAVRHELSDLDDMLRHFSPYWATRIRAMIPQVDPQAEAAGIEVWSQIAEVIRAATEPPQEDAVMMAS